jgi:hypothetical protein
MTQKKSNKQKARKEKQEFSATVEVGQMREAAETTPEVDYMETFYELKEVNIVVYSGVPLQVRIGEISEEKEYLQPIDEIEGICEITV